MLGTISYSFTILGRQDDYTKVWSDRGVTELDHKFPGDSKADQEPFEKIQKLLATEKVPKNTSDSAPPIFIDTKKMLKAPVGIDRDPNQKKVMNDKSATEICS
jgi:hypothetical protein